MSDPVLNIQSTGSISCRWQTLSAWQTEMWFRPRTGKFGIRTAGRRDRLPERPAVRDDNTEYETVFPAVFIHFINVRYLVQQQRIGEGRATMRVRFILNTLNNADEDKECEAFLVFQRLNVAIQDAKNHEPALSERCNLTYFDMPLSTNMLQAYWIDYEVWFRESSAWKYRDWVKRYVVMPPFTQHSDAPQHDSGGHGFHPRPEHDEVSGFSDTGSKN